MDEVIFINPTNQTAKVSVTHKYDSENIQVSRDLSLYYSELARQWAQSDTSVDGIDFSAKYYAQQAAMKLESAVQNMQKQLALQVQIATTQAEIAREKATESAQLLNSRANYDLSNLTSAGKNVIAENVIWGKISGDITTQSDLAALLKNINPIGRPILELCNTLNENEIWLEGATVSRETYAELFEIYGTDYGEVEDETLFVLPDFRDKTIWGGSDFGYIKAGLPNITGTLNTVCNQFSSGDGCFKDMRNSAYNWNVGNNRQTQYNTTYFNATNSNSIYGASTTVQPPAIKIRVKTRYR